MSFDFPPASDDNVTNLSRRFERLRREFSSEREERAVARPEGQAIASLETPPPNMPRPRRRSATWRIRNTPLSGLRRDPASSSNPNTETSRMSNRNRPGIPNHGPRLHRIRQEADEEDREVADELRDRREHLERIGSTVNGIAARLANTSNLREALRYLTEFESRIRSIDPSVNPPPSTSPTMPRASKRRKLDHGSESSQAVLEPYGYCGQVVPGQLKMEIVSDGDRRDDGIFRPAYLDHYRAENVLKDDGSVYSSRSSRCDLMLKQKGEQMFHLESLVIAAPKRGFTAPVHQGVVFVGMSADKLNAATTTIKVHYPDEIEPPSSRSRSTTPGDHLRRRPEPEGEQLSLLEAVNDDHIWQASRGRISFNYPTFRLPPPRPSWRMNTYMPQLPSQDRSLLDHDTASMQEERHYLDNCDWPPLSAAAGFTRAPTPPPFTVTTAIESADDHDELVRYGEYGLRPLRLFDSDIENDSASSSRLARQVFMLNGLRHRVRRGTPANAILADNIVDQSDDDDEDGGEGDAAGRLEPNARFVIPKNDCRITIRFHPPVAGRFLLLKLFSPHPIEGEGIDIEYIAAHGYSGPRFFPSVEMR